MLTDAHDRSAGVGTSDEGDRTIVSTVLPVRRGELRRDQRCLLDRVLALEIDRDPVLRNRRRSLVAIVVAGTVVLGSGFLAALADGEHAAALLLAILGGLWWGGSVWATRRFVRGPARRRVEPWACAGCGYDLAGLMERDGCPCPECGAACAPAQRRRIALSAVDLLAEVNHRGGPLARAVRARPTLRTMEPERLERILRGAHSSYLAWMVTGLGRAMVLIMLLMAIAVMVAGLGMLTGAVMRPDPRGLLGLAPMLAGVLILLRLVPLDVDVAAELDESIRRDAGTPGQQSMGAAATEAMERDDEPSRPWS